MVKRLAGALLCALLALPLVALPALATEAGGQEAGGQEEGPEGGGAGEGATEAEGVSPEGEELEPVPEREEICSRNEVVAQYCPEPYEAPTAFAGILWPLLGLGAVVTAALFLLYIRWLPNFAQERRMARSRR